MCGSAVSIENDWWWTGGLYVQEPGWAKLAGFVPPRRLLSDSHISINHLLFVSGANFVTRKISRSVAKIHLGQQESFYLGNLDSKRDWGHAKDYVEVSTLARTAVLGADCCPRRARSAAHKRACVPTSLEGAA